MSRRRVDRTDRNGDPLDGVVNLFDVAIVLAVAFLVAALAGIGLSEVLSNESVTLVKNPGADNMEVIMRDGDTITKMELSGSREISGMGSLIGRFYRLEDGTTVYVPVADESVRTDPSAPSGSQVRTPPTTTQVTPPAEQQTTPTQRTAPTRLAPPTTAP
jgi:hypothetical protein